MSRIATLNAEIESFKAECQRLKDAENTAKIALSERLRPALSDLREELRQVEREFQQLAPKQEHELQARRQELDTEEAGLTEKVRLQTAVMEQQRAQQEEDKEAVEQNYVVSFFIITLTACADWAFLFNICI